MNKKFLLMANVLLFAGACQCQSKNETKPEEKQEQPKSNRGCGGCCETEKPQAAPAEEKKVTTVVTPEVKQTQATVTAPEVKQQGQVTVSTPEVKVEVKAP